jgi:hypothetical protein
MKPCPNCGSDNLQTNNTYFWVACRKCQLIGPTGMDTEDSERKWDALPRRAEAPTFRGSTYTVDDVDYHVAFTYNGPITFCSICWHTKKGMAQGTYGAACCNPKDTYDKTIGERIAMKGACGLKEGTFAWFVNRKLYSAWRKEQREKIQAEKDALPI